MADEVTKTEETQEEKTNGVAPAQAEEPEEEEVNEEELFEQKLNDTHANVKRFAAHSVPEWKLEQAKESFAWNVRVFPVDQEDCKNCIMDTITKMAQKALYSLPKHKNGQGIVELFFTSNKEVQSVMGRLVRLPFFHRYVTIELTHRSQAGGRGNAAFKKIEDSAILVLDTTKSEKIRNMTVSNEGPKNLWVRYLPTNINTEILQILFPLAQRVSLQTHDGLCVGLVEFSSVPNLQLFLKSYVTVIINDASVLSLHTIEPTTTESTTKAELEKALQALGELKQAPTEIADKHKQRREDKNEIARILKRTMQQQHGDQPPAKRGNAEPSQRGGNWGGDSRWKGSGRFGGGAARAGFGGQINPRAVTAEMMMMQARLNQTIRAQLMMLNSTARRGFGTGIGGRFGGGAGLRGGRIGGQKGFGGGW